MPDWLDCPCGQQLRLPFPGGAKRARCPACKQIHDLSPSPPEEPPTNWLECECGQRLRLPLPGGAKRARCPTCRELVNVPPAQQDGEDAEGTIGLAAEKACPGCRKLLEGAVVICIDCGHDFRSGRRLRQSIPAREDSVILDTPGLLQSSTSVRFIVRRDERGRWWLTAKKRVFGLESDSRATHYALADYDSVVTDYEIDDDVEWYSLELQGRGRSIRVWSGTDANRMRELLDLLRNGPGLTIRRR